MKPRSAAVLLAGAALAAALASCGGDGATDDVTELTLLTHDSFAIPDEVLEAFTRETGVTVTITAGGDAGSVLSQAILTKDNPIADVMFGVDNTFLSRALDEDIFVAYRSPALDDVPADLQLDPEHRVTPIDFGDVCLNYDVEAFGADLAAPANLEDLTDPAYRGLLVVESPATSSPGLAFLLATIARFPEGSGYPWQAYWADLAANDVLVTSGWEEAYYAEFSGGAGEGSRPLVVSYASSPPAEVIFAEPRPEAAPTAVITDGCFRQVEFAGILEGSDGGSAAEALVDFMLGETFQSEVALNMFVFPANADVALPPEFVEFTIVPTAPLTIDPLEIGSRRDAWIGEWIEIMQ
jgi:thiamine transport system substrate-binding protein